MPRRRTDKEQARKAVYQETSAATIHQGCVWEDADILREALAPVGQGGRILSIASAGDNALALLTLDPEDVTVVDANPAQLFCLELRVAAFRRLGDSELLEFLGVTPSERRGRIYTRKLRELLRPETRHFWDTHGRSIAQGIIHAGTLERRIRLLRRFLLPLIHPESRIRQLRSPRTPALKEEFYRRAWDTPRWRWWVHFMCSPRVLAYLGCGPAPLETPASITDLEKSGDSTRPDGLADHLLTRTQHALTQLPVQPNPYLAYLITGTFPPEARPLYLRPGSIGRIRRRLDRLRWVHGSLEQAARGRFDGFNLSRIFEGMTPEQFERAYTNLCERANPGARIVYWSFRAPHAPPPALTARVQPLEELAAQLHSRDSAWFYQAIHVDEVRS